MTATSGFFQCIAIALAIGLTGCGKEEVPSQGSRSGSGSAGEAPGATVTLADTSKQLPSTAATVSAAPPPSTSGSATRAPVAANAIAKLQEDADLHPANFDRKARRLDGVYISAKTRQIGAYAGDFGPRHTVYDIVVADSKGDLDNVVWCEMNIWNQPPSLKQFDSVTVEGTGYLDVAMDGRHKYRLVIASCKLTEKAK
jgi:hypothetical protein